MSQVGSPPTALRPAAGTPAVTGAAVTPTPTDQATGNAPRQQGGGGQPAPQQQPAPQPPAPPAPAVTLAGALTALFAGQPVQAVVVANANGEIVVKLPEAQLILAATEAAKAIEAARGDVLVLKLVASGPNPTVIIASRNGRPVTDPAPLPITIEPIAEPPPAILPAPRRPLPAAPISVPASAAAPPVPGPTAPLAGVAGPAAPPRPGSIAPAPTAAASAPMAPVLLQAEAPALIPASAPPGGATAAATSQQAAPAPLAAALPATADIAAAAPVRVGLERPAITAPPLTVEEPAAVAARPPGPAPTTAAQPVSEPMVPARAPAAASAAPVSAMVDPIAAKPDAPDPATGIRATAVPAQHSGQRPVPFVPPALPPDAPRPATASAPARPPASSLAGTVASHTPPETAEAARPSPRPAPEVRPAPPPAVPAAPAAAPAAAKTAAAELLPIEVGPVPPEDAPIDQRAASAWTALWAAARTDPVAAERVRDMLQPGAGTRLAGGLAFLVSALRGGKLADWLGTADSARLGLPSRSDGRRTVEAEFRDLARMAQERGPDGWRAQPLAVLDGGAVQPVMLYVHRPPRRRKSDPGPEGTSERFMLDLRLSRAGPMRIDGLLRPKALEVIIRTERAVPSRIQRELRQVFGTALEGAGLAGTLGFQKVERLPPPPPMTADDKPHHAVLA